MSDSLTTTTPETTKDEPTVHPPVRENQVEAGINYREIAEHQVMRSIGGASPAAHPDRFAGVLGHSGASAQTGMLRQLQRSYGNSYVGSVIQAKLTVNQPGDIYEQEADRMAAQVMVMPQSDRPIQREIDPKKEKEKIQMKPSLQLASDGNREAGGNLEGRLNSSKGGGSPLPDDVRSFMEPRFGADFSQVRVHTGSESVQMNRDLNAQAFTHKQDVYFGAGKAPAKDALTAHELTHVVQQTGHIQCQSQETPELKKKLDEIEKNYRDMIKASRSKGYNVTADNLDMFLAGTGGIKTIPVLWLRGFSSVIDAERVNQERFENSLSKEAKKLTHGMSKSFTDNWSRMFTASFTTELYYASGTSTIRSIGDFSLSCIEDIVRIGGTVNHHWYDPYDWNQGQSAFIPGFGSVSDDDALLLQKHRGAKPFNMEADWQQRLNGTVTLRKYWFNSNDYYWTGPE
jgi:hypothetical protein